MDLATEKSGLFLHLVLVCLLVIFVCVFELVLLQCLGQAVLSLLSNCFERPELRRALFSVASIELFKEGEESGGESKGRGNSTKPVNSQPERSVMDKQGSQMNRLSRQFCSLPSSYNEYLLGTGPEDATVEHKPHTSNQIIAVHWAKGMAESPHGFSRAQRKQDEPGWELTAQGTIQRGSGV